MSGQSDLGAALDRLAAAIVDVASAAAAMVVQLATTLEGARPADATPDATPDEAPPPSDIPPKTIPVNVTPPDPDTPIPEHGCQICGRTFSRANGLTRHMRQTHHLGDAGPVQVRAPRPPLVPGVAAVLGCPKDGCDYQTITPERMHRHRTDNAHHPTR